MQDSALPSKWPGTLHSWQANWPWRGRLLGTTGGMSINSLQSQTRKGQKPSVSGERPGLGMLTGRASLVSFWLFGFFFFPVNLSISSFKSPPCSYRAGVRPEGSAGAGGWGAPCLPEEKEDDLLFSADPKEWWRRAPSNILHLICSKVTEEHAKSTRDDIGSFQRSSRPLSPPMNVTSDAGAVP